MAAGSAGKNPCGPSSVAVRPASTISDRTWSGSSWTPQPGTSETPHEMGAAASFTSGGHFAHAHGTVLAPRPVARERHPQRHLGVLHRAGAGAPVPRELH